MTECQKFVTVYPAIYCRKHDIIMNVASHWLMSGFTLQNEFALRANYYSLKDEDMKKCIKMFITVLKLVIWKG